VGPLFYEFQFPWLSELRDLEEEDSFVAPPEDTSLDTDDGLPPDPAQQWLSVEEFSALPEAERNQRALDRYLRSRKSAWQLGQDYTTGQSARQDGPGASRPVWRCDSVSPSGVVARSPGGVGS
jgi:hypothetical protein